MIRLTRFGFHYLEQLFYILGVEIHVLNENSKETMEQELVRDMIAIVSSFSGKLYGMRSNKRKRILSYVKKATIRKNHDNIG